jgi:hypothetical protein
MTRNETRMEEAAMLAAICKLSCLELAAHERTNELTNKCALNNSASNIKKEGMTVFYVSFV